MTTDGYTLATPAPAFAQHFNDPLYDDPGDAFAPFGSDEGSDLLASWAERRADLDETSTLATILGCEPNAVATYAGEMDGIDGIETAMFITSAAFVLLRLTGHINEADQQQALAALDFQLNTLRLAETRLHSAPSVTTSAPGVTQPDRHSEHKLDHSHSPPGWPASLLSLSPTTWFGW